MRHSEISDRISLTDISDTVFSIGELLCRTHREYADSIAIEFGGKAFSHAQLELLCGRMAKGLSNLNIGPSEHVAIQLGNSLDFVVALLGTLMAGIIPVVLSPLLPVSRVREQLRGKPIRAIIASEDRSVPTGRESITIICDVAGSLAEADLFEITEIGKKKRRRSSEIPIRELMDNDGIYRPSRVENPREEVAAILFTGGTTGEAKGVMLTHGNFSAATEVWARQLTGPSVNGRARLLCVLPLFHIFGLTVALLASIRAGVQIILRRKFDAVRTLSDIQSKRVSILLGVPTMYSMLLSFSTLRTYDLSSLEYCAVGGAPATDALIDGMRVKTGIVLRTAYALTETTSTGAHQLPFGDPVMPTAGKVAPGNIVETVAVEDGMKLLAPGSVGEICFRGPHVFKGYWDRPQDTRAAFLGDRFHTGDVGYVREDGYLVILDRKKDMLLCGGHNVYPRLIENALTQHPAIQEAAVIGIADPTFGERPKAFLVIREGEEIPTADELLEFLWPRLARYEIPVVFERRTILPKTPVGKLDRAKLREGERSKMSLVFP